MKQALREPLGAQLLVRELCEEARRFRFDVAPNPCVGAAVLSDDGSVVSRGFHEHWGGPHAELAALEAAAKSGVAKERWTTLVVTLEPCSTHGKTPPCTEAVIASGIRKVLVGAEDPDARHRGRGLERLREAGLEAGLVGEAPLETVAPHFLAWNAHERVRRPRPWVLAKWAQTRSGQLLPPEDVGGGRWISGPESLREVQILRARSDAIVTGAGTVRADDPRMSVRPPADLSHPPLRVVLDADLRTPPDARILRPVPDADREREAAGATLIVCRPGADPGRHRELAQAGAEIVNVKSGPKGRLSLRAVSDLLWERGVQRVLLEAGTTLLEAYLESGFADQVRVYTGSVNGGRGLSMGSWLAPDGLSDRLDRECGEDTVLEAFLPPRG